MGKYLIKRLLLAIVTIWAVATITFVLMNMVPGGPFLSEKAISPAATRALEAKYGLDKPFIERYGTYLKDALHGDFGLSLKQRGRTVTQIITTKFPVSAKVGVVSVIVSLLLGVPLGVLTAFKRGTAVDSFFSVLATLGIAVPSFVICTVLMYFFGVKLGWLPTLGLTTWKHYIMPVFALAAYPTSYIMRLMRSSMLDVLGQDYMRTARAPNYWNADAVKLDSIKFMLIEDANAAYSAYQSGEVKMIKDVPTEEIPSLSDNDEFHTAAMIGTYYLNLNCQKDIFKDVKVRKALSLAIDRKYVAEEVMQKTYTPATAFIGPGWKDSDGTDFSAKANGGKPYIDVDNFDANLEEAKKLLEEAGYPGGEGFPQITYTTNDAGYHKPVAEYLQQAWGELGIDVKVDVVEWESFTSMRRNGEYETARNGWVGDYDDPSNMLDLLYSSNGNNDGKYNNPEYDAQVDIVRSTVDPEERSAAMHKAEDILMEDCGCVPVAFYSEFWLQKPEIEGSWYSPYGYWYFMYADLAE